jgi:hypothetical protein
MLFQDFVLGVRFRDLQPDEYIAPAITQYLALHPHYLAEFETVNTILPPCENAVALQELCMIPRLSTFAVAAIINMAVSSMPDDQVYLNIGVWYGFTLFAGMVGNASRRCIGVDNFSLLANSEAFQERFQQRASDQHVFFCLDFETYFRTRHRQPIGLYYYDGPHEYQNQLCGLQLADPYLADQAIIIIDDANWEAPRQATLAFLEQRAASYRILCNLPTACDRHPTWWNGLLILQKISST